MPDTPSAPLSAKRLDIIEVQHSEYNGEGVCCECGDPWPCEVVHLLSMARDALALREAAEAVLCDRYGEVIIGDDHSNFVSVEILDALMGAVLAAGRATAGTQEGQHD